MNIYGLNVFPRRNDTISFVRRSEKSNLSFHDFHTSDFVGRLNNNFPLSNPPNGANSQLIGLFSAKYQFNIFEFMPRLFTISTKTGSCQFNSYILKDTSTVIAKFLEENPEQTEYHLDIDDNVNTLGKFEQMYQGEFVIFDEDELPISHKITKLLNIVNCPNFLKPESLSSPEQQGYRYSLGFGPNNDNSVLGVQIDFSTLKQYLQSEASRTFKIHVNDKEYKCSIFGVYSSVILRQLLLKDPTLNSYVYNFENEFNEFQPICDIFNFQAVILTKNNMDSIREIAEGLQINAILPDVDKYINKTEKVSQQIDEQQTIIDSVDELFDLLYKIKEKSVESVKRSIIDSKWSQTDDNLKELAAFIIQVVKTDFSLHQYMIDLLIQLGEEEEKFKNMTKLIVNRVFAYICPPFDDHKKDKKKEIPNTLYGFAYNSYKRGMIDKKELNDKLNYMRKDNPKIKLWFYPELKEINPWFVNIGDNFFIDSEENYTEDESKMIEKYLKMFCEDRIEEYKKMRDSGEPEDQLTRALRKDDVDTVQSILSKQNNDFQRFLIPFNIFENYIINGQTNLINYAAAYGSVKCFKYLLLNYMKPDQATLTHAVYGGNIEIIKIVAQQVNEKNISLIKHVPSFMHESKFSTSYEVIVPAIMKHRNDLFDWIFEQNFIDINPNSSDCIELFKCSVENGNAHSLIALIDNGLDITDKPFFDFVTELACINGFYSIAHLIINLNNKDTSFNFSEKDQFWQISFDNVSIFKLFVKKMSPNNLEKTLIYAIEENYINVIKYYFEQLFDDSLTLTFECATEILSKSIGKDDNKLFFYLIDQIKQINSGSLKEAFNFSTILNAACSESNFEIAKMITDIIIEEDPQTDFTKFFIRANISGNDICKYFVEKNLNINYNDLSTSASELGSLSVDLFQTIIKKVTPESKVKIMNCFNHAISSGNKELVTYLLKEVPLSDRSLIYAVRSNDLELVNIILKENSQPSFINQIFENGTALCDAVNSDLSIVKRLLSIPGIDPSLCNRNNETPLSRAFSYNRFDVVDAIIDFYGDDKQNLKWQFEIIIRAIIDANNQSSFSYSFSFSSHPKKESKEEREKNIKILSRILDTKAIDPNYHYKTNTLLTYACSKKSTELVKKLLEYDDIDVNMHSQSTSEPPFMTAVQISNENIDIFNLLIKHPKININKNSDDGKSPLIIATSSHYANIVDAILNNEKFDPVESHLNYAFYLSEENISRLLCTRKELDVNYVGDLKNNIIHRDITLFGHKNSSGFGNSNNNNNKQNIDDDDDDEYLGRTLLSSQYETSLESAVSSSDIEKVDLILQHPSFDKVKSQLKNAIKRSVKKKETEIFKKLIQYDDEYPNIVSKGHSLLYYSILYFSKDIFEDIFNNPKFDSKKSNILDCFVLSYSFPKKFILNNNRRRDNNDNQFHNPNNFNNHIANPNFNINFNNLNGINPMPIYNINYFQNNNIIINNNNNNNNNDFDNEENENEQRTWLFSVMKELLKYDIEHEHLIDFSKLIPSGKSFFTAFAFPSSNDKEIAEFLLEHGCNPNEPDKDGIYPLQHAIIINSSGFVDALIETQQVCLTKQIPYKANKYDMLDTTLNQPHRKLPKYTTYLHLAAAVGNKDVLKEILDQEGIDINVTDDLGETPLMAACRSRKKESIITLFENKNLDYLHQNNDGNDALRIFSPLSDQNVTDKDQYRQMLMMNMGDNYSVNDIHFMNDAARHQNNYMRTINRSEASNLFKSPLLSSPKEIKLIDSIEKESKLQKATMKTTLSSFGDLKSTDEKQAPTFNTNAENESNSLSPKFSFSFDSNKEAFKSAGTKFGFNNLSFNPFSKLSKFKKDALSEMKSPAMNSTFSFDLNSEPLDSEDENFVFDSLDDSAELFSKNPDFKLHAFDELSSPVLDANMPSDLNEESVKLSDTFSFGSRDDSREQAPAAKSSFGQFSRAPDFSLHAPKEAKNPEMNFNLSSDLNEESVKLNGTFSFGSRDDSREQAPAAKSSFGPFSMAPDFSLHAPKKAKNPAPKGDAGRKKQRGVEHGRGGSFQREVEDAIVDVFGDADEEEVRRLSRSLSRITSRRISHRARRLAEAEEEGARLQHEQRMALDQNAMMIQQQQQQWLQMIHMNNLGQARLNAQMQQMQMSGQTQQESKKRRRRGTKK